MVPPESFLKMSKTTQLRKHCGTSFSFWSASVDLRLVPLHSVNFQIEFQDFFLKDVFQRAIFTHVVVDCKTA